VRFTHHKDHHRKQKIFLKNGRSNSKKEFVEFRKFLA
jgi:hypothetical protein